MEQLLSVEQFAARLGGISPMTVHTWLSLGRFGLVRTKIGSRTMLAESELLKVVNASNKAPAPRAPRGRAR
jgi:predicted site-specific integrase-resolvase